MEMSNCLDMLKALEMFENVGYGGELNGIQDKVERVQFIRAKQSFKMRYQQATRFQNDPKKSALQSDLYREKGNKCYAEGKFFATLEYFNASICFAPERSEQLAKAYANRSAVYFSTKMYGLSLKNIKLAREAGYPEHLTSKLVEREAKCVNELKKLETKPKKEFQGLKPELSYPPHEKVPYIANCLDLKVNEKYGRHIVTKVDLKVGDVVAIERPFSATISATARYTACVNCFRENDLDLIPCPNCHSAMFCSSECLTAANEAFHAIECPIMDVLAHSEKILSQEYGVFRLFIMAMNNFVSVDELMQFTKDLEHREQSVFDVINDKRQIIDFLASALKLKVQPVTSKNIPVITNTIGTALITEILLNLTVFKKSFKSEKETKFLINFIYRLFETVAFYITQSNCARNSEPGMQHLLQADTSYHGLYLFSSLLNHSCAPNVNEFNHGTEKVMVVIKPIKSGEQLFQCFEPEHKGQDRQTRQQTIHYMTSATCDCLACIRDYPQLQQRDLMQNHGFIEPMHHMRLCDEHQIEALKELIPKYCKYLNEHSEEFPYNHTIVAEYVLCKSLEVLFLDELPLLDKMRLQFK